MSKMAELAVEIENLYFDERMSFADIEKRTGLPYANIEAYLKDLDPDSEESWDGFNSDAEADADALASAGWGTDEDYGGDCEQF